MQPILPSGGYLGGFGRKHHWTHGQAMFSLFLKGYGSNQQFIVVQETLAITSNEIPSIGQDLISCNLKLVEL